MEFVKFNGGKTLSLANLLSVQNTDLARAVKKEEYLYISCLEDEILGSGNLIRCEIGSISYVLALLCKYCLDFSKFNESIKSYFDKLDDGFLSGECNVGEDEFDNEIAPFMRDCENIIIDSSFFRHKDSNLIFKFLSLLDRNIILSDNSQENIKVDFELSEPKELDNFDGSVVFVCDTSKILSNTLIGSNSFAMIAKIKDNDLVQVVADGLKSQMKFCVDSKMKGTIALCSTQFSGYDFKLAKIIKVG